MLQADAEAEEAPHGAAKCKCEGNGLMRNGLCDGRRSTYDERRTRHQGGPICRIAFYALCLGYAYGLPMAMATMVKGDTQEDLGSWVYYVLPLYVLANMQAVHETSCLSVAETSVQLVRE